MGYRAVGDVIGTPGLASTSMEQGRLAALHAFGVEAHQMPSRLPYGIHAIPEIAMVGPTEHQLTEAAVPYEAGVSRSRELFTRRLFRLGGVLAVLLIGVGVLYWTTSSGSAKADNAQTAGNRAPISPRGSGTVVRVLVDARRS